MTLIYYTIVTQTVEFRLSHVADMAFFQISKRTAWKRAVNECTAEALLKIEWLSLIVRIPTAATIFKAGSIPHNMLVGCASKVALQAGHPISLALKIMKWVHINHIQYKDKCTIYHQLHIKRHIQQKHTSFKDTIQALNPLLVPYTKATTC